jgi:hypothetical protein
MLKKMRCS